MGRYMETDYGILKFCTGQESTMVEKFGAHRAAVTPWDGQYGLDTADFNYEYLLELYNTPEVQALGFSVEEIVEQNPHTLKHSVDSQQRKGPICDFVMGLKLFQILREHPILVFDVELY